MIPLKLQLKNFISYGSDIQTIDFSTYPLICLSGKNGHGKSALLDAITWALWGQARKVTGNAKADQGLLRLGQTQMMVCLDFLFNEQPYRVRREFAVTYGKPYAALDFGLLNEQEQFIPLTDKTISLTQAKIENTLNLTFDSFANSAFLRQGQSNEFSKKSPKDRKEILATILGLNQYDTVRRLAMEKMRSITVEKTTRQTIQTSLEAELTKKEAILAGLEQVATELIKNTEHEKQLDARKATYTTQHKELSEQQQQYQKLVYHHEQTKKQELEFQQTLRTAFMQWREVHKQQLTLPDVKQLEATKQTLLQEIQDHQTSLQKNLELKEQILLQKDTIQIFIQKYSSQQMQALNQQKITLELVLVDKKNTELKHKEIIVSITQKEQEKKLLQTQHKNLSEQLKADQSTTQNYAQVEKQFEKRKEYYQKFLEQGRWINSELESLEQKKHLAIADDDPSCPLCEQNLSAARKRFLKSKLSEQEKFLRYRLQRITAVVKKLKIILIEQHKHYEQLKKIVEQQALAAAKLIDIQQAIEKVDTHLLVLGTEHAQQVVRLQELELVSAAQQQTVNVLTLQSAHPNITDPLYVQTQDSLKKLEQSLATTVYNQQKHHHAMQQLTALEKQLNSYQTIQQQALSQSHRQNGIEDICIQLKKIKVDCTKLQATMNTYAALEQKIVHLTHEHLAIDAEYKKITTTTQDLLQQKARFETQRTALENAEKEYAAQGSLIAEINQALHDYTAIAQATGKDGIQALLIEDAIPEIETEANYLLSKLTNNQAQIFIESLRDLKKGGTKETLDIKISDIQGIRPYELFSGGEAFRIDFALRIAISKLLARRAGTSLQTLIIDEGFGSQDEDGLALIMDALYKIQDDFAKIIIVSHLVAMKDQFPVHFVVEKGPQGSYVQVFEQG